MLYCCETGLIEMLSRKFNSAETPLQALLLSIHVVGSICWFHMPYYSANTILRSEVDLDHSGDNTALLYIEEV